MYIILLCFKYLIYSVITNVLNMKFKFNVKSVNFNSIKCYSLFSQVFCDFGTEFIVSDINGETVKTNMVASVTKVTI